MKIALIGSTQYRDRMEAYKKKLIQQGHAVLMPKFDEDAKLMEILEHNRRIIREADRVDVFWDGRSIGTVFDFGMVFALEKPLKVVYLEEEKTLARAMKIYASGSAGLSEVGQEAVKRWLCPDCSGEAVGVEVQSLGLSFAVCRDCGRVFLGREER